MKRGYTISGPSADPTEPWEGFEWRLGDSYNIADVALTTAKPETTALRHTSVEGVRTTVSYGELQDAVDSMTASLASVGVEIGDAVGVCLPQCPELLITQLAVFRRGAIVVPLSMLLGDDSFSYSLSHSGAAALVVDEVRQRQLKETPEDLTVLNVSPNVDDTPLGGLAEHTVDRQTPPPVDRSPDDPALIMYTSGTTGKPKGVVQGHQYLAGSLPGYQAWFELFGSESAKETRVWTPAEWAWAGALFDVVFPTLALDNTVVSNERRSGFDPDNAFALIEHERVTNTFMPPTALNRIRNEASVADYDLSSLEVVMCGGEKLSKSLFTWAEEQLNVTVNEAYGQTEANAIVGNCRRAYPARPGSMGKPYPGHDVVVVDESGDEVADGEVGEIALRLPDPVVFLGYLNDASATDAKNRDGLFLTGDLAVRDEDGYLWHQGRKDDLILTSGYRVSPLEVEAALESHAHVAVAVVGGVPDEQRGERIKAYIVPDGTSPDLHALQEWVRDELGAHKVPREITIIDDVPETRSGKADRTALFDE